MSSDYYYSIIENNIISLKIVCGPSTQLPALPPEPLAATELFTVFIALPFLEGHIIGIIQHKTFSDWLLSLSNRNLSSSMSFVADSLFLLVLNGVPLSGWTTVYLSFHLLKNMHPASLTFWGGGKALRLR